MTNYERLGLYPHNVRASEEVKEAFENGQDIVSIVHATGTGKSYNALALAMDNKDQKIIWVVPTNAIKEHIEKTINDNPLLNRDNDFPNLEIITYSSLVNKSRDEIKNMSCDLLIVDELHHLGAPVWGQRINDFIDIHKDLKVFGMTAYTVRDRGTIYERDMVNPETDEIFSDSVVSNFDLYDALIEGVLPKPVVRSVITEDDDIIQEIRDSIEHLKKKGDTKYQEYERMLNDTVKIIHKQPGVKELVQQSVKPGGKYIYFCPVIKEEGVNDIPTIKNKMMEYLQEKFPNQKIVFYSSTSKDGELGRKNRDRFYCDLDLQGNECKDAIRIIFVINQYNEGVHAPNVDGVFLGRKTGSDIVAFEQIGRALSVRGDNYQELEKYRSLSLEELRNLATSRGLPIEDNYNKEQIIDLLVSPLIIDLANNMEFIEELETNLGTRLKKARQEQSTGQKRLIKITDSSLNHQIINRNILEILKSMRENLRTMTWDDKFNLLKAYYDHHGHSNVPQSFKTINGYEYEEEGIRLGVWIQVQRREYKNGKLSKERLQKLSKLDFKYNLGEEYLEEEWNRKFKLLQIYYTHQGHSNVPQGFKTINGYEHDENGIPLGKWVGQQRQNYKNDQLSEERIQKLSEVGFKYSIQEEKFEKQWNSQYKLLQIYYNHHGHSNVPDGFKTNNGYEYAENGKKLGDWVNNQRAKYKKNKMSKDRVSKLNEINFIFYPEVRESEWNQMYELLQIYYEHYGHSNIPSTFKTVNGWEEDKKNGDLKLARWVITQRQEQDKLSLERRKKLDALNFVYNPLEEKWNQMYELLKNYYEHHKNTLVSPKFKTVNGYEFDEKGEKLGAWVQDQREFNNNNTLSPDRKKLLDQIEFIYNGREYKWNQMYKLLQIFYNYYGHSNVPNEFKTINGYEFDENGEKLFQWCQVQQREFDRENYSQERLDKLNLLGFRFNSRKEHTNKVIELCNQHGLNYKKYKILSNIPYQELYAKIEFLHENNIPLEINGELNPIFGMSNENMKVIHGISKEELISKYYINSSKKGL